MPRDLPDKILWSLLSLTAIALAVVLFSHSSRTSAAGSGEGIDKAVEREIIAQSRMALLQKLYGPVEQLRADGQLQAALLKLEEVGRSYPGEAHGSMLQGEILLQMGAFDEGVASLVRAVRLNGEYVDAKSPLSRRGQIEKTVKEGLAGMKGRGQGGAGKEVQKNLFYLQSRLAGGCE